MSEQLEATAAEAIDKAMHGVDVLTAKLAELAQQYGPDVVNAALGVARVEAAQGIATGLVLGVSASVATYFGIRSVSNGVSQHKTYWTPGTPPSAPEGTFDIITGSLLSIVGGGIGISAALHLCDLWAWVGIFEPKLYIAHRLLDGVL